ncbi:O-antigen ligase family protein [Patescibacteria group bacterium]|nr:O-antigen ligase family protein [Patescibacteria group bacterium]
MKVIINNIDRFIDYLIYAIVLIIPVYIAFFNEFYDIFILPKLVIFQVLVGGGWLLLIFKYFVDKDNLRTGLRFSKVQVTLISLCFLYLVSVFISSVFSLNLNQSIWGGNLREQGFVSYFFYVLFFLLLVFSVSSLSQIKRFIICLCAASFVVCVFGLLQFFGVMENSFADRLSSTLGHPNYLGHYLIIVIPLSIYSVYFLASNMFWRVSLLGLVVLQFICLILTYSRAAWLGLGFAVLIILIFFALNLKRLDALKFKLNMVHYVIMIGILFLGIVLMQLSPIFAQRVKSIADFSSGSVKNRMIHWGSALDELRGATSVRVLFGYGPDTLDYIFAKHYKPELAIYEKVNTYPSRAHSFVLDSLLQVGIIGFLLLISIFCYILSLGLSCIRGLDKSNRDECWLIIALACSLFAHTVNDLFSFSLVVGNMMALLCLGFMVILVQNLCVLSDSFVVLYFNEIYFKRLLLMVVMVFALFMSYELIFVARADFFRSRADKYLTSNNCSDFVENINMAIFLNPNKVTYKEDFLEYGSRCLSQMETGVVKHELVSDLLSIVKDIKLMNYSFRSMISVAHAYTYIGSYYNSEYFSEAEMEYKKAIEYNPNFTIHYRNLAQLLFWQDRPTEALAYLNRGLNKLPDLANEKLNLIIHGEHKEEVRIEREVFENLISQIDK